MYEKTVRAHLGSPTGATLGNDSGITQLVFSRTSPREVLLVSFNPRRHGDPVAYIQAAGTPGTYRTAAGVGLGSSKATIRRAIPGLRCTRISCTGHRRGTTMTISFSKGRASLITLGKLPS